MPSLNIFRLPLTVFGVCVFALLSACEMTHGARNVQAGYPGSEVTQPVVSPACIDRTRCSLHVEAGDQSGIVVDNSRQFAIADPDAESVNNNTRWMLNFDDVQLEQIVHVVLSDFLESRYVIAAPLEGLVTVKSVRPLDKHQLLAVLEVLLSFNSLVLSQSPDGTFWLDRGNTLVPALPALNAVNPMAGQGFLVVPLKFISADDAANLLRHVSQGDVNISADERSGLLLLSGRQLQLEMWLDVIESFDVDILAGMSVGVIPVQNETVEEMETRLSFLMGSEQGVSGSLSSAPVRFMPLRGTNSLLVVSPNRGQVERVEQWLRTMDIPLQDNLDLKLFVYPLAYADASQVAQKLKALYQDPYGGNAVFAVSNDNRLIIYSSFRAFRDLWSFLDQIDRPAKQIRLDVEVIEILFEDDADVMTEWVLRSQVRHDSESVLRWSPGVTGTQGLTYGIVAASEDWEARLRVLAQQSRIRSHSRASLLVQHNHAGRFRSGEQVATLEKRVVNDQQQELLSSYIYHETGLVVDVAVTPGGRGAVILELEQTMGSLGPMERLGSEASGYALRQKGISTKLMVKDGETALLGGVVRGNRSGARSEAGLIRGIPGLSLLFGGRNRGDDYSQWIIRVTPRVVANP